MDTNFSDQLKIIQQANANVKNFNNLTGAKKNFGGRIVVILSKQNDPKAELIDSKGIKQLYDWLVLKGKALFNNSKVLSQREYTKLEKGKVEQALKDLAKVISSAKGDPEILSQIKSDSGYDKTSLNELLHFFSFNQEDSTYRQVRAIQAEITLLNSINDLAKRIGSSDTIDQQKAVLDFLKLENDIGEDNWFNKTTNDLDQIHDEMDVAQDAHTSIVQYYNQLKEMLAPDLKKAMINNVGLRNELSKVPPYNPLSNSPPDLFQKFAYYNQLQKVKDAVLDKNYSQDFYNIIFNPPHPQLQEIWQDEIAGLQDRFMNKVTESLFVDLNIIRNAAADPGQKAEAWIHIQDRLVELRGFENPPQRLIREMEYIDSHLVKIAEERLHDHVQAVSKKLDVLKEESANASAKAQSAEQKWDATIASRKARAERLESSMKMLKELEFLTLKSSDLEHMELSASEKDLILALQRQIKSGQTNDLGDENSFKPMQQLVERLEIMQASNQKKMAELSIKAKAAPATAQSILASRQNQLDETMRSINNFVGIIGSLLEQKGMTSRHPTFPQDSNAFYAILNSLSDDEVNNVLQSFKLFINQNLVSQGAARDAVGQLWAQLHSDQAKTQEEIKDLRNLQQIVLQNPQILKTISDLESNLKENLVKLGLIKTNEKIPDIVELQKRRAKKKISDQDWSTVNSLLSAIALRQADVYKRPLSILNRLNTEQRTAAELLGTFRNNFDKMSDLQRDVKYIFFLQSGHEALEDAQSQENRAKQEHYTSALSSANKGIELEELSRQHQSLVEGDLGYFAENPLFWADQPDQKEEFRRMASQ